MKIYIVTKNSEVVGVLDEESFTEFNKTMVKEGKELREYWDRRDELSFNFLEENYEKALKESYNSGNIAESIELEMKLKKVELDRKIKSLEKKQHADTYYIDCYLKAYNLKIEEGEFNHLNMGIIKSSQERLW